MLLPHTERPARCRCCTLLSCCRRASRAPFHITARAQQQQERRCCSVPRTLRTAHNHISLPHEQVTARQAAPLLVHSKTDQAGLLEPSSAHGNLDFAGARTLEHALSLLPARMPLCRFLGAHSARVRVSRRPVKAGAADPPPLCRCRRGCRWIRAQRLAEARAEGRTRARALVRAAWQGEPRALARGLRDQQRGGGG